MKIKFPDRHRIKIYLLKASLVTKDIKNCIEQTPQGFIAYHLIDELGFTCQKAKVNEHEGRIRIIRGQNDDPHGAPRLAIKLTKFNRMAMNVLQRCFLVALVGYNTMLLNRVTSHKLHWSLNYQYIIFLLPTQRNTLPQTVERNQNFY